MKQEAEDREESVYSVKLSGITCTNCAGNIEKMLRGQLTEETATVRVSVMS